MRSPCRVAGLDPATAGLRLSSPALRAFLAETRNSRPAVLRVAAGLGLRAGRRGAVDRHQAAMGAVLRQHQGGHHGSDRHLHARRRGILSGTIRTLSLNVKARFVPAEASSNEKAPALRVLAGTVEIGAAWKRTSKDNSVYHSVKLDDPSFPAPIFANLVEVEGGYALVWSR